MNNLAPGTKVYLACRPVDMRSGFNGLAAKVQQLLGRDPFDGQLYLFRGKRGDYFKGIYWDGTGLWLVAKRLEKGRFVWPPIVDGALRTRWAGQPQRGGTDPVDRCDAPH